MEYVLLAVLGLVILVLLIRMWLMSRAQRRRIAAVVARLETGDVLGEIERMHTAERALTRLERAADDATAEAESRMADGRRFSESLDRLDDGVVVADESGLITYANAVAKEFLGARHAYAIVDRHVREDLATAIRDEEASERELDLMGPPRRYLSLLTFPLDDGHRTIGATAFIFDRTHERRVNEVRRDFVANISHELKTPVASLGLLAETLTDTLDEPEVAGRLARRLLGESHRLVDIIDDLIELSQVEAQEAPAREPVLLDVVAAGAVDRVRRDFADRDVAITTDIDPAVAIIGDRRQLVSAIYNLVQNAVKYSEPGSPVSVASEATDSEIRISVCDSGVGIPASELDRIWERFYVVDRARSRRTGGTGLGLAIVRHVVQNHGGTVRVESREGAGSTFTVSLPRAVLATNPMPATATIVPTSGEPAVDVAVDVGSRV